MRLSIRRGLLTIAIALGSGEARAQVPSFTSETARDSLGRRVDVHVHEPAGARAIALFIQGSGCASHFPVIDGRRRGGYASLLAQQGAGRISVMAVEKPGVAPGDPGNGGAAVGCPEAFLREHTLDRWVGALASAVDARRGWRGPVVVIGHSEGASAAARLASREPRVSHVAFLSGSGPSQLFDLELRARRAGEVSNFSATLAAIRAEPDSIVRFAWGHPFRRWSGFLDAAPMRDLLDSTANLYVAHGTADEQVPIESFDALRAHLATFGRAALFDRRDGADHALNRPGQTTPQGMAETFRAILDWVERG